MDDIDRSFTWWQNALKGERGPIDADNPKAGFYRSKRKDKSLHAVAIWYDSNSGELRYQENGRDVDDLRARERWPHDSRRPIPEDVFWHFRETGVWKDVDQAAVAAPINDTKPAPTIAEKIAAAKVAALKYKKIESDEDLTLAQSLRAHLLDLKGEVDKAGKALYEPLYRDYKAVYDEWSPLVKALDAEAVTIREAMEAWNDFKLEQAAKMIAAVESAAPMSGQASPTPVASNAPPPSVQIAGGGGRAASVAVKSVVTAIDLEKAWQQFGGLPEVYNLFMELAQRSVNAGVDTPCATVEKKSAIR